MNTVRATARFATKLCIACGVFGFALPAASSLFAAENPRSKPAAKVEPKAGTSNLVQAALLAEASGNNESRRELLREALKENPNSSLAHWCVGEVCQNGRWFSVEEIQHQATADKRLAEYRTLRDQHAATPAGQLTLARWCGDHGLPAESRIHWTYVLVDQPENEEAIKALGARWYRGQLLTEAQIKLVQRADSQQSLAPMSVNRESMAHWVPSVTKWRYALKRGDSSAEESLRQEVGSATDRRSIHALGCVVISGSRRRSDPKGYRLLSLALIDALDRCNKPWAVKQLAWHAVEHPTIEVRHAAADALKKRPMMSYVPLLLSQMQTTIEGRIIVRSSSAGVGVVIDQTFEREGPDAVYRDARLQNYHAGTPRINFTMTQRKGKTTTTYETNIPQVTYNSWRDAGNYAVAKQKQVDQANEAITDLNERIQDSLSRATGEKANTDPSSWQEWWTKYCCKYYELEPIIPDIADSSGKSYPYDYEQSQPERKPVIEQRQTYGTPARAIVTYVYVRVGSCFPWNTKVWTLTGPVDIGRIKPGDRVLSQQPFTGELSYQPVLQVTRRKPSPMIEIGLGSETVQATRGHPFWVSGQGWKMAKELTVGMCLHGIDGPIRIDRVEQIPAAAPWYDQPDTQPGEELSYNLVLEECHNYFVGPRKILVHDNTLFPLDGPVPAVPGLASP